MTQVTLGKTGITVWKNGFGALPIQRTPREEAVKILRKAFDGGITFFDTARAYSDSEAKLGEAFRDVRKRLFLSTKTQAKTADKFWKDLEESLRTLGTDYIDIYQFHNPAVCPVPGDGSGLYEAMTEAKKQGKIRFIGLTNHRLSVAGDAIASGLYDTLQFPFSYLASEKDVELVRRCGEQNMGFLAMKGLSGGLITNAAAAYAYMEQFPGVLPIWGIQRESELDEFLSYRDNPPSLSGKYQQLIDEDRKLLVGNFCRACGYCMPCPKGIEINTCARVSLSMKRMPMERFLTKEFQEKMKKVEDCIHCGRCASRCPYNLDTPRLLQENYRYYQNYLKEQGQKA